MRLICFLLTWYTCIFFNFAPSYSLTITIFQLLLAFLILFNYRFREIFWNKFCHRINMCNTAVGTFYVVPCSCLRCLVNSKRNTFKNIWGIKPYYFRKVYEDVNPFRNVSAQDYAMMLGYTFKNFRNVSEN